MATSEVLLEAPLVLPEDQWEIVMRVLRREYRGEVTQHYEEHTDKSKALLAALEQLDSLAEPRPVHQAVKEWRVTPR